MLKILINGRDNIIRNDEYYVRQLANGLDEVIFYVSIYDPIYPYITEETKVTDMDGQTYLVKQIDAGKTDAKIIAQLDLNEWKAIMHIAWGNAIKTAAETIELVKPTGWTVVDQSGVTSRLTVNGNMNSYEVCVECCDVYKVYVRWNNGTKTVTIYDQNLADPVGAFATRELNMKELNYKGKSTGITTRLYAYGVDGMSFASINDGKPYVDDHTYTDAVICAYWKDERYKVPENLLEAAREKLAEMAVPVRSYSCSVVDLQATDPQKYGFLDFAMFTTATLIDDIKGFSMDYQVVERHVYPYYPEKNEVVFDSAPQRITRELNNTKELLSQKTDQEQVQTQVDRATGVLQTGKSGYVVIGRNQDGYANELYFLDQPQLADARQVLRINKAGLGFSSSGTGGPYNQSWTLDGKLTLGGVNNGYGDLLILDEHAIPTIQVDKAGLKLWKIEDAGYLYNGVMYEDAAHTTPITPTMGKYYFDRVDNTVYSYGNNGYEAVQDNEGLLAKMTSDGLGMFEGEIDLKWNGQTGIKFIAGQAGTSDELQIGDFIVSSQENYGRQIWESSDEMTGMSGEPEEGQYFLWAGWRSDSDFAFVVENQGGGGSDVTKVNGQLLVNGVDIMEYISEMSVGDEDVTEAGEQYEGVAVDLGGTPTPVESWE